MKIEMLAVGELGTNCYFLINEDNNNLIVVDPGGNGDRLAERINSNNLTLSAILLTHGHCDHTDGIEDLRAGISYPVEVYALKDEEETLLNPSINMSVNMGWGSKTYPADKYLNDGDTLTIGGMTFEVIATPGHTKGGCCYYFRDDNLLLSGDTLFAQSIGRTDFPGGSMEVLSDSIKNRLYTLPDDTDVLPGHMGATTIGREKVSNMFVRP